MKRPAFLLVFLFLLAGAGAADAPAGARRMMFLGLTCRNDLPQLVLALAALALASGRRVAIAPEHAALFRRIARELRYEDAPDASGRSPR